MTRDYSQIGDPYHISEMTAQSADTRCARPAAGEFWGSRRARLHSVGSAQAPYAS